jgi:hypothetical protein
MRSFDASQTKKMRRRRKRKTKATAMKMIQRMARTKVIRNRS